MLLTRKRRKIEMYLQWNTYRKSYMAYQMAATVVTLNDLEAFEGHSPVAGLFKCNPNPSNICAVFYTTRGVYPPKTLEQVPSPPFLFHSLPCLPLEVCPLNPARKYVGALSVLGNPESARPPLPLNPPPFACAVSHFDRNKSIY